MSVCDGSAALLTYPTDARFEALARTELLRELPSATLFDLATGAQPRDYATGQFLVVQGEPAGPVLVLIRGAATVYRAGSQGTRAALAHLRPPAAVGELTLLDAGPRSTSVQAVMPTAALELSRDDLLVVLSENPSLLDALMHSLARLVQQLSDRVADAVLLDVQGRLAKTLLVLTDWGSNGHVVHLSQSQLADLVGCGRQSLNQALGGLADRGLLHQEGRTIVLDDHPGLRRRAGLPPLPSTPPCVAVPAMRAVSHAAPRSGGPGTLRRHPVRSGLRECDGRGSGAQTQSARHETTTAALGA